MRSGYRLRSNRFAADFSGHGFQYQSVNHIAADALPALAESVGVAVALPWRAVWRYENAGQQKLRGVLSDAAALELGDATINLCEHAIRLLFRYQRRMRKLG